MSSKTHDMMRKFTLKVALVFSLAGPAWAAVAPTPLQDNVTAKNNLNLPPSVTLYPEYAHYALPPQAQQGDNCWAYSIVGCLELELSRLRHTTVTLSGPFLVWAAARSDADAVDNSGSNFGRACRALEQYGICQNNLSPALSIDAPGDTRVSTAARRDALDVAKGIHINWIRFWNPAGGLTSAEMQTLKQTLAAGHPVAVGMRWPKTLRVENPQLGLLATCTSEDEVYDGHCVTLVGYEESARYAGGGAFVIRNTWGPDWMTHGYAKLPFQYVQQFTNDLLSFDAGTPDAVSQSLEPTGAVLSNVSPEPAPWIVNLKAQDCTRDPSLRLVDDDIGRYKKGVWCQDDQIFASAKSPGQGFTTSITVAAAGVYSLCVAGSKAPDYGTYSFSVDGHPVGKAYDFCWANVEPTGRINLGTVTLTQGVHTLRVECAGKSPASRGYLLGLDWIGLAPQQPVFTPAGAFPAA